jgi:hypothetical protein
MTVTNEGDEMAPEKELCEPADCPSCNKRDACDDYDPGEEDEELAKEEVDKRRRIPQVQSHK